MNTKSSPWQVSAGGGREAWEMPATFQGCHGMPRSDHRPQPRSHFPPHVGRPLREFINQVLGGLCIFILPPLLSPLFYQGTLGEKVMINFNKNKIKMIKPFISVRDNLSSAGWSNLEENKCEP